MKTTTFNKHYNPKQESLLENFRFNCVLDGLLKYCPRHYTGISIIVFIFLISNLFISFGYGELLINDIKMYPYKISIELNNTDFSYKYNFLSKYKIIYIDIQNSKLNTGITKYNYNNSSYFKKIKLSKFKKNVRRIVIYCYDDVEYDIRQNGNILNIMFEEEPVIQEKKIKQKKVIVIDAGHGGDDPGTVFGNLKEKNIVLKTAFYLKKNLDKLFGDSVEINLTRTKDEYLTLQQRRKYVKDKNADIFISIHVNSSSFNKKANGASVYFVSEKGASDRESEMLAKRENIADIINNRYNIIDDNNPLSYILLDIGKRNIINKSIKFAQFIDKQIINKKLLNTRGVKRAPFVVLKSLRAPSVLIELAFITNKHDRRLLKSDWFLKKYANCIALACSDFFDYEKTISGPDKNSE